MPVISSLHPTSKPSKNSKSHTIEVTISPIRGFTIPHSREARLERNKQPADNPKIIIATIIAINSQNFPQSYGFYVPLQK